MSKCGALGFGQILKEEYVGSFKVGELEGVVGEEHCFYAWEFKEELLADKSDVGVITWSRLED